MPDETTNGQDAQGTQSTNGTSGTQASGTDQQQGKIEDLPTWAQSLVKELRDEAASRRLALKKQEEDNAKATQARLAEEGKWKELAEARAAEAAKLQPYQERASALEKIISANNAQMIQQIPEQMRGIVPPLAAEALNEWLVKNLPLLQRKAAPDLDAGAGQGGSGVKPLTDEDRFAMKVGGMTEEQYRKVQAKINGQS